MLRLRVVDSHTGGEPTRVVLDGQLDLGGGTVADQREAFRARFDGHRSAVVCEPRGSDVVVGALLCPPADPTCDAGVIFFNNVGYLGMCGHGTIGVVRTLQHLGRLESRRGAAGDAGRRGRRPTPTTTAASPSTTWRRTATGRGYPSTCPASAPCAATSPGAATGSSSRPTTGST